MKHLPLLALLLATTAHAQTGAVRCAHLLDVTTGLTLQNQLITFDAGHVTAITAAPPKLPDNTIDLGQLTCLPGLIDAHVHLTEDPNHSGYDGLATSVPRSVTIGARNARNTLRAGFTTVRNVGARGYADIALRDGIAAGDIDGPRMLVSGPPLGITGGHADEDRLPPEFHAVADGVADGPWEARHKVRENVKYGADLIKIMASGGVLSKGDQPGAEQYSLEEMQAIVTEAHKLGRKVAAHAHGTQAIKDAIIAGVDSIEHASLIDDEGIALAKQHHTYLVMDIYDDDYILATGSASGGMLPESIEKEKKLGRLQRENFRRAHAAGALMAFGTDAGVYPHGDNAKQFAKMVQWGMTPLQAIQSATIEAAKLLGLPNEVGTLTPGHAADLIAVPTNPTQDITTLEHVQFVLQNGWVKRNLSAE
jgi:imidazolonepropionase-like amidohydrolase